MHASLNAGRIEIVAGLSEPVDWTAKGKDGKAVLIIDELDYVRFKLAATASGDPILDLIDGDESDNGSRVTINTRGTLDPATFATGQVMLAERDTAGLSGVHFYELLLIDSAEPTERQDKMICRGEINFLPSLGGQKGPPA